MTDRTLFDQFEPIDPTQLVERIPGIDAVCPAGLTETSCRWRIARVTALTAIRLPRRRKETQHDCNAD